MTQATKTNSESTVADAKKTEATPAIPVIDDALLVELFTETGESLKANDAELAKIELDLSQRLESVQEQRKENKLSLRALDYVDVVHNNIALTVRPMALELTRFLCDSDSAFSAYSVPKRYSDTPEKDLNLSSRTLRAMLKEKGEPAVKPLDEAKAIAVFPATLAMSVWVRNSGPFEKADADIKYPEAMGKCIVLGFESGWYVCPLRETHTGIFGAANPPRRMFRHYTTRDGAIRAAYDYATTAKLTKRVTIPPELEDVYEKSEANLAECQAFHAQKRADREAAGEPEPDMMSNMFKTEEGEPEDFKSWLA